MVLWFDGYSWTLGPKVMLISWGQESDTATPKAIRPNLELIK